MNNKYKFEIGQIVTHAASKSHDPLFVVITRCFVENIDGVEEIYICSTPNNSGVHRLLFSATEIKSTDK